MFQEAGQLSRGDGLKMVRFETAHQLGKLCLGDLIGADRVARLHDGVEHDRNDNRPWSAVVRRPFVPQVLAGV